MFVGHKMTKEKIYNKYFFIFLQFVLFIFTSPKINYFMQKYFLTNYITHF